MVTTQSPPEERTSTPMRGVLVGIASLVITGLLVLHEWLPNVFGLATAIESFLPWLGLAIPVLLVFTLIRRSWFSALAWVAMTVVWVVMFVPMLVPAQGVSGTHLTVATQNLGATNAEPKTAARALASANADLVAVEEMSSATRSRVSDVLGSTYDHHAVIDSVGLWSKYPLRNTQSVDLGLGWTRALRTTASTPLGDVNVYVAHLGSIRFGDQTSRDETLKRLARRIAADGSKRVVLAGDLNTATTDRMMDELTTTLSDANETNGAGFGFTWPAQFPLTRPDHVLYRGLQAVDSQVLGAHGSDHRAAVVTLQP